MSVENTNSSYTALDPRVAVEFGVVTAVLAGVYLWQRIVRAVVTAVFGTGVDGGLLVSGLFSSGLFVGGVALVAAAFVSVRDVDAGLRLPSRSDLPFVGLAALAPLALVGLTKLVGTASGVPYNSLTMTSYAAGSPLVPILTVAGLGLLVGVPSLVLVCQVLVQRGFEGVVGPDRAVVLTTLTSGLVLVSSTGGLAAVPEPGRLVGAGAFTLLLAVALYAPTYTDSARLRRLSYVPVALFGGLVVLSGVAGIDTVAGGLFVVAHLAVFGIGAYTYERTSSLVVPALAYGCLSAANTAVVVAFEAGMQSW